MKASRLGVNTTWMTNTLSEANFLIELEYDMVSQPHATTNVGPSL